MTDGCYVPIRCCSVCKKRRAKKELVRFTFKDGSIVLDAQQTEPGRGAYCCAGRCQKLFEAKKQKWQAVFRVK